MSKKVYLYPDFRQADRVEIYEVDKNLKSGYALTGCYKMELVLQDHPNWVWLTPENREKASKNFEKQDMDHLVCDDCKNQNETVMDTICPYKQELHGEEDPCNLCPECYTERCRDI